MKDVESKIAGHDLEVKDLPFQEFRYFSFPIPRKPFSSGVCEGKPFGLAEFRKISKFSFLMENHINDNHGEFTLGEFTLVINFVVFNQFDNLGLKLKVLKFLGIQPNQTR